MRAKVALSKDVLRVRQSPLKVQHSGKDTRYHSPGSTGKRRRIRQCIATVNAPGLTTRRSPGRGLGGMARGYVSVLGLAKLLRPFLGVDVP